MVKRILFLISVVLFLSCIMIIPSVGMAADGGGIFENGTFETGDLTGWEGTGDVGVADFNVISEEYSAYMTTAPGGVEMNGYSAQAQLSAFPAYNNMCSWLNSGFAYPQNVPQALNVSFKVRYKTNEKTGNTGCYDPFNAQLVTVDGTIELVLIETDGITPGPGTSVRNLTTNGLIRPPVIPPFTCQEGLFSCETPVFEVKKRFEYTNCAPVSVKYAICDACDEDVDSAAFIDDVSITFEDKFASLKGRTVTTVPCPPIGSISLPQRGR